MQIQIQLREADKFSRLLNSGLLETALGSQLFPQLCSLAFKAPHMLSKTGFSSLTCNIFKNLPLCFSKWTVAFSQSVFLVPCYFLASIFSLSSEVLNWTHNLSPSYPFSDPPSQMKVLAPIACFAILNSPSSK